MVNEQIFNMLTAPTPPQNPYIVAWCATLQFQRIHINFKSGAPGNNIGILWWGRGVSV